MKKKVSLFILTVLLPLFAGLTVYLLFRPSAGISEFFYTLLGFPQLHVIAPNSVFGDLIRFYLCDFLWAFSLTSALCLLLDKKRFAPVLALLICVVLGSALEICQGSGITSGTFDFLDIIAELIGSALSLIILHIIFYGGKKNEKSNP